METWLKLWKVITGLYTHHDEVGFNFIRWQNSQTIAFLKDLEDFSDLQVSWVQKNHPTRSEKSCTVTGYAQNRTLSWNEFVAAIALVHEKRMGQPTHRRVIVDKPKEEDYFYANPQERLCEGTNCDLLGHGNSSKTK